MQQPLFTPFSNWRPPSIGDLPDWSGAKRIAIDVETNDPTLRTLGPGVRRNGYIAGYSFAIEDSNHKHYIPLRHAGGDNMENPDQALAYLRHQAKNFSGEIVGANLSYDLDYLFQQNIEFPNIKMYRDVQVAEPLIWEFARSFSLETICQKYLGIGKDEGILREAALCYGIDPKKDLHMLPARFVGEYAEADAALPLLVLRRQEKEIEEQDLWRIYNMESELLPVLVKMRRRGVRVSLDRLAKVEEWSKQQERGALEEIEQLTGVKIPFNSVWQASAIVPALQQIGCKIPVTPKTKKPSIDKMFLSSIDHPVATAIARARRVNKIRTTFCESIREHIIGDRIHATFHQLRTSSDDDEDGEGSGARFGRCSSSNPNLQQQPAKDPEIGPMWRSIYIPEEGELWCSADFSSQEPRMAVHYATVAKLQNIKIKDDKGKEVWIDAKDSAKLMAEKYRTDPSTDPHQQLANIIMGRIATKDERSAAKIIFLGLSYGMGGAKLCRSLGYPTMQAVYSSSLKRAVAAESEEGRRAIEEGGRIYEAAGPQGQALLDNFDAAVPFVRSLSKVLQKTATAQGYIRTQEGRKCRFEKDDSGNIIDAHKAGNKLIQGSSADQTKMVMIALDKEGIFMTAQIHDEIASSIKNRNESKRIVEIMENTYKLSVPTRVDCEIGPSWGEAK